MARPLPPWPRRVSNRFSSCTPTTRDSVLGGVGDRELSRLLDIGLSQQLDYYTEYIDLARFPDQQYQAGFREFLRLKYSAQRFDVVIAVEEASLEFVNKNRDELFPGVPVVFFALDPDTRRMTNSTGVLAELGFSRTLTLATALQPDIQQVFVVSGASARDRFYESLARKQSPLARPGCHDHLSVRSAGQGARGARVGIAATFDHLLPARVAGRRRRERETAGVSGPPRDHREPTDLLLGRLHHGSWCRGWQPAPSRKRGGRAGAAGLEGVAGPGRPTASPSLRPGSTSLRSIGASWNVGTSTKDACPPVRSSSFES